MNQHKSPQKGTEHNPLASLFIILLSLLSSSFIWAQAPAGIQFQGVARDGSGTPINSASIMVDFRIQDGSATTVYHESHNTSTDTYGLFNLVIGQGTVNSGSFSTISWGTSLHQVQIDIDAGGGYMPMGVCSFQSVPYALYAENGSVWSSNGDHAYYNQGRVGIGVSSPKATLHLADTSSVLFGNNPGGPGSKFIYHGDKAAMRIGHLDILYNQNWNYDSIGLYSFAAGRNSKVVPNEGFAFSGVVSGSKAAAFHGIAEGFRSYALGGTAIGDSSFSLNGTANGTGSIALGGTADGYRSLAVGNNQALGNHSVALGYNTEANNHYSTSFGSNTEANGYYSIALGTQTEANGSGSLAAGFLSRADGAYSMAMGYQPDATGDFSIAMGALSSAIGTYSTAMGFFTDASGHSATSMGYGTEAVGANSVSMGTGTTSTSYSSLAIGRYNVETGSILNWIDTDPVFVIGDGTDQYTTSNSFMIQKNGQTSIGYDSPTGMLQVSTALGSIHSGGGLNLNNATLLLGTTGSGIAFDANQMESVGGTLYLNYTVGHNVSLGYGGGSVGIGTASPSARFQVDAASGEDAFRARVNGNTKLMVHDNGGVSVGVNTTPPNNGLVIAGIVHPSLNGGYNLGTATHRWNVVFAVNGTIQTSDARLKKDIVSSPYGLSTLMQMHPVQFNWKDPSMPQRKIGFIAQELQEIVPEVVQGNAAEEMLGVNYAELVPVLVSAIQEQEINMQQMEARLEKLEKENEQLKALLGPMHK